MDPVWLLRTFYLGASALIIALDVFEPLRSRFLTYGSRLAPTSNSSAEQEKEKDKVGRIQPRPSRSAISALLDAVANLRVPHSFFGHFYICSTLTSLVWGQQILSKGPLFTYVADRYLATYGSKTSMNPPQVFLMWCLLFAQASRRLYESYFVSRPSKSQMWFVHWLLGLAFYFALSMSVWVEGIPALAAQPAYTSTIQASPLPAVTPKSIADLFLSFAPTRLVTYLPKPTYAMIWFLPVVFIASGMQNDTHTYLATLPLGPDYKKPQHPAFTYLITPHYLFECLVYFSWMFIAAPDGKWINTTMFCAFVFVLVNLGVTARGTKEWWERKWGKESVEGKWKMIPFLW